MNLYRGFAPVCSARYCAPREEGGNNRRGISSSGNPLRIPLSVFERVFGCTERAVIILEHLDYLLRLRGRESTFGYAARSIEALEAPLETMRSELKGIAGVGSVTERLLREIIDTGSSGYYERLLLGRV